MTVWTAPLKGRAGASYSIHLWMLLSQKLQTYCSDFYHLWLQFHTFCREGSYARRAPLVHKDTISPSHHIHFLWPVCSVVLAASQNTPEINRSPCKKNWLRRVAPWAGFSSLSEQINLNSQNTAIPSACPHTHTLSKLISPWRCWAEAFICVA